MKKKEINPIGISGWKWGSRQEKNKWHRRKAFRGRKVVQIMQHRSMLVKKSHWTNRNPNHDRDKKKQLGKLEKTSFQIFEYLLTKYRQLARIVIGRQKKNVPIEWRIQSIDQSSTVELLDSCDCVIVGVQEKKSKNKWSFHTEMETKQTTNQPPNSYFGWTKIKQNIRTLMHTDRHTSHIQASDMVRIKDWKISDWQIALLSPFYHTSI